MGKSDSGEREPLSKEQTYLLSENMKDVFFTLDQNGHFTFLNPAWEKLTGFSPAESLNKPISQFFHHEDWANWQQVLSDSSLESWRSQCRVVNRFGEYRWLEVNVTVKRNQQGKMIEGVGTFIDVSSRQDKEVCILSEVDLARRLQQNVLSKPIENEDVSILGIYHPSEKLSGDMYSWYRIDSSRYGVIVIDVMGHGLSSALISMSIRSLLRGLITRVAKPLEVMRELNHHMMNLFSSHDDQAMYFTAIYVEIDTDKREISYYNAGHPYGLLVEEGEDTVQLLDEGGLPIGMMPDIIEVEGKLEYKAPMKLFLYTDGLLDELSPGRPSSFQYFKELAKQTDNMDSQTAVQYIWDQVQDKGSNKDDICLICLRTR